MSHHRNRYIKPALQWSLSHSPVVGVLGQRQSGKTTLVSELSSEYVTLDRRAELNQAIADPDHFLTHRKSPFAIDECQLAPPLFPAVKEAVRMNPKKGQFILTGSVRFLSRKAIRESLTGRITNLELLPMSWTEAHEYPLSDLPALLLKSFSTLEAYLSERARLFKNTESQAKYLDTGGLPGICFSRDHSIRHDRLESHLETLLERDLRLLVETRLSYPTLRNLLRTIALRQCQPFDLSEVARVARISRPTLRSLLRAFEGLFLIREATPLGGTARSTYFFEDQGMATFLAQNQADQNHELIRLLFSNVFPQFHYQKASATQIHYYYTRGGAHVPIVFKTLSGAFGYIPILENRPTRSSLASATRFLGSQKNARVVIAHQGDEIVEWSDRIYSLPMRYLF